MNQGLTLVQAGLGLKFMEITQTPESRDYRHESWVKDLGQGLSQVLGLGH